ALRREPVPGGQLGDDLDLGDVEKGLGCDRAAQLVPLVEAFDGELFGPRRGLVDRYGRDLPGHQTDVVVAIDVRAGDLHFGADGEQTPLEDAEVVIIEAELEASGKVGVLLDAHVDELLEDVRGKGSDVHAEFHH